MLGGGRQKLTLLPSLADADILVAAPIAYFEADAHHGTAASMAFRLLAKQEPTSVSPLGREKVLLHARYFVLWVWTVWGNCSTDCRIENNCPIRRHT
jgi:hypothetical protein